MLACKYRRGFRKGAPQQRCSSCPGSEGGLRREERGCVEPLARTFIGQWFSLAQEGIQLQLDLMAAFSPEVSPLLFCFCQAAVCRETVVLFRCSTAKGGLFSPKLFALLLLRRSEPDPVSPGDAGDVKYYCRKSRPTETFMPPRKSGWLKVCLYLSALPTSKCCHFVHVAVHTSGWRRYRPLDPR